MIELLNINKAFDNSVLFENFNLKIENGAFAMITGASGSGKTTLLNMIGGIEMPDSGTILVDNNNIAERATKLNYFRKTVGFLFQNYALIGNKTVNENLKIVQSGCRSDISIDDALSYLGLSEKKDTKVYKLSGGEQQRVALARLMVKKCSLILADEPTGSLDSNNAEIVMKILQKLNHDGKTIVMVTHNPDLLSYSTVHIEL